MQSYIQTEFSVLSSCVSFHVYDFTIEVVKLLLILFQVLTSYPYSDPQYGGVLTPYGPQAVVCFTD